MRPTSIACVVALAVVGWMLPGRQAAAEDYAVQVVLHGAVALTPADQGSPPDYFAEMSIAGSPYRSNVIFDRDRIAPEWAHFAVFSRNELLGGPPVGIAVGLRDTDDAWGVASKPVDIYGRGGIFDLNYVLRFDPRGGAVILYDAVTGRPVRQLQPLPGGSTWTTGRMITGGRIAPSARVALEVNVVRLPRYRY
jgi:hypothetical protein